MAAAVAALCPRPPSLVGGAQDQSAATVKDVILARKTLMNSINDGMDRIGEMTALHAFDSRKAGLYAADIAAMLMAFPHLFPPASNQWKESGDFDPATDTIASPDIWTSFADFYRRAAAAANTASELSRADREDEVRRLHRALWVACDTCHALSINE